MSLTAVPEHELQFDGERFTPGAGVEISYHHWLRYFFASKFTGGKRVLDIASGEGYGAAFLSENAKAVDAIDVDEKSIAHARLAYGKLPRVIFRKASLEEFLEKSDPGSYDVVTAFEVIEHVDARVQELLLNGIRRVLTPSGLAVISTPDKRLYSDAKLAKNPFHIREFYREEFVSFLRGAFPNVYLFDQACFTGAAIFSPGADRAAVCRMGWTDLIALKGRCEMGLAGQGEYLVAVVSQDPLPDEAVPESTLIVDSAQKLVVEGVYERQVALNQATRKNTEMRDNVAALEREVVELRNRPHLRTDAAETQSRLQLIERVVEEKVAVLERDLVAARSEIAARPDPVETKHRLDALMMLMDRMVLVDARNHEEIARLQAADAGRACLVSEFNRVNHLYYFETGRRAEIEAMVSVRLMLRAKRLWDRVPRLKKIVKAVVEKALL